MCISHPRKRCRDSGRNGDRRGGVPKAAYLRRHSVIVDSSVALAMINGFDGVKGRWKVNDFTAAPILNYAVCSHATETNTPSDFRTGDAGILAELIVQS